MKDMMSMVKQAQQMKSKMEEMQAQLATIEMEGSAGGDMVKAIVNGENRVLRVQIDPSATADVETLEDLITVAVNDALTKVKLYVSGEMKKISGGMDLPF